MDNHFDLFQSKKYWHKDEEKINQHLYVTLCLYQSACSDFVTSLDLNKDKRYSWTIVSSYYSIMHSLRTIIFIAIGDFPKEHRVLSKIFFDEQDRTTSNRYTGNSWLREFDSNAPEITRNIEFFSRIHLAEYYESKLRFKNSDMHFLKIGKLLKLTKEIRNDSNYEALIVAHEKRHFIISDNFIKLTKSMLKTAEYCISIATKCLKQFLDLNDEFETNRDSIKWFTYEFLLTRFKSSIENRSKRRYLTNRIHKYSRNIIRSLLEKGFADIKDTISEDYTEIEENISLKIFGEKRNLMDKFQKKVLDLEDIVSELRLIRK